ncbi:MAG: hypothetical protein ABIK68_10680 [bacterium]
MMMKKPLLLMILILVWCLSPAPVWAAEPWQEPVTPLPGVSLDRARIAEGVPYCYAGYGTQQSILKIGGRTVQSDAVSNPYLPGADPFSTTFLRFGCKNDMLFMDFSTLDDSMRFDQNVQVDGQTYNSIRYQYRVLAVGTSFSLVTHRLYMDLGLGYALIDYRLGLYGSQYASQYEGETDSADNLLVRVSFRYIINHFIMVHWQQEQTIDKESIVSYSNQLGLNFISRF